MLLADVLYNKFIGVNLSRCFNPWIKQIKVLQPAIQSLYTLTRRYDVVKEQLLRAQAQGKYIVAHNIWCGWSVGSA